jgi:hypothetical protein
MHRCEFWQICARKLVKREMLIDQRSASRQNRDVAVTELHRPETLSARPQPRGSRRIDVMVLHGSPHGGPPPGIPQITRQQREHGELYPPGHAVALDPPGHRARAPITPLQGFDALALTSGLHARARRGDEYTYARRRTRQTPARRGTTCRLSRSGTRSTRVAASMSAAGRGARGETPSRELSSDAVAAVTA